MNRPTTLRLSKWSYLCLLASSFFLWNCGLSNDTGKVSISVSQGALVTQDIQKVKVSVLAKDFATIEQDLLKKDNKWAGLIRQIPAGSKRSFRAVAYNSANKALFEGSTGNIHIEKGKTTSVLIMLQDQNRREPFINHPPIVDSLVAYPETVDINENVTLKAAVRDTDKNDKVKVAWSASGGTFADAGSSETTWSATQEGTYTLTITISDKYGSSIVASTQLFVKGPQEGSAAVEAKFNMWPVVSSVTASLGQIQAGTSVALKATASDLDGDMIQYSWSDEGGDCAGSFLNINGPTPIWTAPKQMPKNKKCSLTVTAQDGRGGIHRGHTVLIFGKAPIFRKVVPSIDTQPPTTTPDLPSGSDLSVFHSLLLTCKDQGSGCKRIVFTTDGSTPSFNPPNGTIIQGDKALVSSFPFDPMIQITIKFASEDKVGNVEPVQVAKYTTTF